jgi:glycosyltransferase involved in cell wall biosynthesis
LKRRLAVVWHSFGPYHYARLRALAERFDAVGIQITPEESERGWGKGSWANDLHVYSARPRGAHTGLITSDPIMLWRILEEVRAEVVLVPGYASTAALTAAVWAKLRGALPVLMSDSTAEDRARSGARERAKRALVRRLFSCAVVSGARAARYAERLGISPERIAFDYDVVDNGFFEIGVDRLRGSVKPGDLNLPNEYFLFVGRLAPEKNIETLLRALSLYRAQGGAWSLAIVGRGPLEGELKREIRRLGLNDKVAILGSRDAEELLPFYAFARCLVLPSISDPWGLVVNEAMASGLPVVVSNRCGCVEDLVKPEVNGFIIDPRDETGLADSLLRIEQMTEQSRRAMGVRSKAIIERYVPAKFAAEIESLLARILVA